MNDKKPRIPSNFKELIGERFGRLTVLKRVPDKEKESKQHTTFWECLCDCGNKIITSSKRLRGGKTTSCGCYQKECASKKNKKENNFLFNRKENLCVIIDNKGNKAIIDYEDYEKVKNIYWCTNSYGYWYGKKYWKDKTLYLHRFLLNIDSKLVVDHINHNPNDNRKKNLRVCTIKQNVRNSNKVLNTTSGARGVGIRCGKYFAQIQYDSKGYYLKQYDTLEEAIYARAIVEDILFEEYSGVNWGNTKIPINSEKIKKEMEEKANKIKSQKDSEKK